MSHWNIARLLLLANMVQGDAWYNPHGASTLGDYSLNPVWLNGTRQLLSFENTKITNWTLYM